MSLVPTSRPPHTPTTPRFNATTAAIVGCFVLALILATFVSGNPFKAMVLAYTDYSGTPAAGAPKASTTRAPETAQQVQQQDDAKK